VPLPFDIAIDIESVMFSRHVGVAVIGRASHQLTHAASATGEPVRIRTIRRVVTRVIAVTANQAQRRCHRICGERNGNCCESGDDVMGTG